MQSRPYVLFEINGHELAVAQGKARRACAPRARLVPVHRGHFSVVDEKQQLLARTSPKGRKIAHVPRFTENAFNV